MCYFCKESFDIPIYLPGKAISSRVQLVDSMGKLTWATTIIETFIVCIITHSSLIFDADKPPQMTRVICILSICLMFDFSPDMLCVVSFAQYTKCGSIELPLLSCWNFGFKPIQYKSVNQSNGSP